MAVVQCIPAPGHSPNDKLGVPIPAGGIPVDAKDPYYAALFLGGTAIRRQPVSGTVVEVITGIDEAGVANGLTGLVTDDLAATTIASNAQTIVTSGRTAPGDGGGGEFVGIIGSVATADNLDVFSAPNGRWFRANTDAIESRQAGADLNVAADQAAALQAAVNANVGGHIRIPAGSTHTGQVTARCGMRGLGKRSVLAQHVAPSLANQNIIFHAPSDHPIIAITGSITAGQRTFFTSDTDTLAPGSEMIMRVGEDPTDPNECLMRWYDVVTAVDPDVSFTVAIGATFACPAPSGGLPAHTAAHRCMHLAIPCQGYVVDGLMLTSGAQRAIQAGHFLYNQGVRVQGLWLDDVNIGFVFGGCESMIVEGLYAKLCLKQSPGSTAFLSVNGCTNMIFRGCGSHDIQDFGIYLESHNLSCLFENMLLRSGPDSSGTGVPVIFIGGGSRGIVFRNITFQAAATRTLVAETSAPGDVIEYRFENTAIMGEDCFSYPLHHHYGWLLYQDTMWTLRRSQEISFVIETSATHTVHLPRGLLCRLHGKITDDDGVTSAVITNSGGGLLDVEPQIHDNVNTPQTFAVGHIGVATQVNRANSEDNVLTIVTNGSAPGTAVLSLTIDTLIRAETDDPAYPFVVVT